MSTFLKLPREIRDMIYDYCLVVNGHIVPYKENCERDTDQDYTGEKPAVGLLAVNKAIRDEAAPTFYGKNIWRITSQADKLGDDGSTFSNPDSKTIWTIHAALFRHVIVHAHQLDVDELDAKVLLDIARPQPANATLEEHIMQADHKHDFIHMHKSWMFQFDAVLSMPNLISLTFDLHNLFWRSGYCSYGSLREFFASFADCWESYLLKEGIPTNKLADNVEVTYVVRLNNSELEAVQTAGSCWLRPHVPYVV
ncbi:MAG: hypothetical protein Q9191_006349 [Dirinaria sp. TL-2023a]